MLGSDTKQVAHGGRSKRVAHVVDTGKAQVKLHGSAAWQRRRTVGAPQLVKLDVCARRVVGLACAKREGAHARRGGNVAGNPRGIVVLAPQKHARLNVQGVARLLPQGRDQLGLCAGNVETAAEDADVRRTHVRDDADVGAGNSGDGLNLMHGVHAHLHHERLGVERARQHREGRTERGVEVAGSGMRLELGRKNACAHLLRRGLARRSRDADHHAMQLVAPPGGKILQGLLSRSGQKQGRIAGTGTRKLSLGWLAGHDDRRRTCLKRPSNVVVAVDALTHKGNEQATVLNLARVDGDPHDTSGLPRALYDARADRLGDLTRLGVKHRASPFVQTT